MKIRSTLLSLAALAVMGTGLSATAQDIPPAVEARQGQFQLMALNIGVLGNMARGNTDYDAGAAQTAADNLVTLSRIDQSFHWPEGTDNFALDGTRALPAIWDNLPDVVSKWNDFGAAAVELQAVAANGQGAIGPALGPVGGTCKACHDDYRTPE